MQQGKAVPESTGPLTIAIIGAGKAGRSVAAEAVRAGYRVVLEDVLPSRLREALQEIVTTGLPGTLELATEVEDAVREADLVIDFVPDELESKLEIVSLVDRMAPPKTVLCVPTVSLEIQDLASCTYRPERCVGASWTDNTVQLTTAVLTTREVLDLVDRFWTSLGRQVVHKH